jgi:Flp pilus assembly pilin Flp
MKRIFRDGDEAGGAAIEYIIVSIFAMVVAVAGVTLVSKAVKKKLDDIQQKYGIELESDGLVF